MKIPCTICYRHYMQHTSLYCTHKFCNYHLDPIIDGYRSSYICKICQLCVSKMRKTKRYNGKLPWYVPVLYLLHSIYVYLRVKLVIDVYNLYVCLSKYLTKITAATIRTKNKMNKYNPYSKYHRHKRNKRTRKRKFNRRK